MDEFPEGFDLAALLAPVPGEVPAGADLRNDSSPQSLYYRLRDARAEARAAERAMESDPEATAVPPQWRTVRDLALEAIAARSKDLEIAAWLTEALLRSDGLTGFIAGVRLMNGLVDGFWDDLFPLPDEDGIATRVGPVSGLNGQSGEGTLSQPLRKLPLFQRPDGATMQFWQFEQSSDLAAIVDAERRQQRIDAGVVPFDTVENEARAAGTAHFAALRDQAAAAADAWRELGEGLDSRAGADAPPTSRVREILDRITTVAARFASPDGAAPAAATPEPAAGAGATAGSGAAAPEVSAAASAGTLASREEALRSLAAIADFFRRTEPLSPLSYTLQEAVRRARMSWPDLLAEIVPDTGLRDQILTSLGIRPPPPE
ncbi:MAG TPA: type VI secretion system protein TssA [Stellaceae bacterium]|nr:type VI secretion system protein TssA [Stellaceae bacterium]